MMTGLALTLEQSHPLENYSTSSKLLTLLAADHCRNLRRQKILKWQPSGRHRSERVIRTSFNSPPGTNRERMNEFIRIKL